MSQSCDTTPRLQELLAAAERTVERVDACVLSGATTLQCQLLASDFHESLLQALRTSPGNPVLGRAVAQLRISRHVFATPASIASELHTVAAVLQKAVEAPPQVGERPLLRVIQGGLT